MKEAFVSFSGGKESCLALYRALKEFRVKYLVNMISEDGQVSRSHGIKAELLRVQAEAIGIPIIQRKCSWETYEEEFKKVIDYLKTKGVSVGVFGDIDIQGHRDWIERVCNETQITAYLPLWGEEQRELISEFIALGFKAIVVAIDSEVLGKEWLGRVIDNWFLKELQDMRDINICGERGEYHTFVYDGPIFKWCVELKKGNKLLKDKHCFFGD